MKEFWVNFKQPLQKTISMNSIDLQGQTAVITGGAQGIGFAIAERLIKSGAHVALWDIDSALLEKSAEKLGNNTIIHQVDITDPQAVNNAALAARESMQSISILVNSAGIAGPNVPLDSYPIEAWQQVINLNLNGTFYVNRAIVPYMRQSGYGRIVNIASVAGKEGNPNASAYSASKAGVIGLTKSLGKELADQNIAVNCITPAAAKTRIFDQMSEQHIKYMLSKIPRERFVQVEEIAAMVAWLVSSENSFTTAGVFDISGGRATY
ncbi:MAG: NAD(P)-dependent dehydrogenase (short-subunit alcohol dehydrogenase family) [Parasphingorhabdus sp.]